MLRILGQAVLFLTCAAIVLVALLTVTLGVAEVADRVAATIHSDGTG